MICHRGVQPSGYQSLSILQSLPWVFLWYSMGRWSVSIQFSGSSLVRLSLHCSYNIRAIVYARELWSQKPTAPTKFNICRALQVGTWYCSCTPSAQDRSRAREWSRTFTAPSSACSARGSGQVVKHIRRRCATNYLYVTAIKFNICSTLHVHYSTPRARLVPAPARCGHWFLPHLVPEGLVKPSNVFARK